MNLASLTAALITLLASSALSFAEDSGTPASPPPQAAAPSETTPLTGEDKREPTPEEKAEKEARFRR